MKKLLLALVLLLSVLLPGCSSKPKEEETFSVTISGKTIFLGVDTVQAVQDKGIIEGYEDENGEFASYATDDFAEESFDSRSYYSDVPFGIDGKEVCELEITNASSSAINYYEGLITQVYISNGYFEDGNFPGVAVNGTDIDWTSIKASCDALGGEYSDNGACTLMSEAAGKNLHVTLGNNLISENQDALSYILVSIEQE